MILKDVETFKSQDYLSNNEKIVKNWWKWIITDTEYQCWKMDSVVRFIS